MSSKTRSKMIVERGRFMVPNMLTLTSMILGLASIFYSIQGLYSAAGWLIMFCVIFDKLDGSSARLFNATSRFGMELDSFSDFVAFGIAPAVLVYSLLRSTPELAPVQDEVIFFYIGVVWLVIASALRLARFNIITETKGTFMIGLPTTVVGGLIALYVLTGLNHLEGSEFFAKWLKFTPYLMILLGAFEVSNLKLPKVAKRKSRRFNAFQGSMFLMLVILTFLRALPEVLLFIGSVTIIVSMLYCILRQDQIADIIAAEEDVAPDDGGDTEAEEE